MLFITNFDIITVSIHYVDNATGIKRSITFDALREIDHQISNLANNIATDDFYGSRDTTPADRVSLNKMFTANSVRIIAASVVI